MNIADKENCSLKPVVLSQCRFALCHSFICTVSAGEEVAQARDDPLGRSKRYTRGKKLG